MNTPTPLSIAPQAKTAAQFLIALIEQESANPTDPHAVFWGERAVLLLQAVDRILLALDPVEKQVSCVQRVLNGLSMETLRTWMTSDTLQDTEHRFLLNYLRSLPGYQLPTLDNPNPTQSQTAMDQHGYYWQKILSVARGNETKIEQWRAALERQALRESLASSAFGSAATAVSSSENDPNANRWHRRL